MNKEKLLLHFCCGPCGAGVVEKLTKQFLITGFFYNPNIWPEEEYKRRLQTCEKAAAAMKIELISGPYENSIFEERVKDYSQEKEGGKRCLVCYQLRLKKTAATAREMGLGIFATTLTISPFKKAEAINAIGKEAALEYGLNFYEADFKEDKGFPKSIKLSHELGLYRQKYCGCRYSSKG